MRNGGDRVASSRAIGRSAGISAAFRGRQHDVRSYETGDEGRSRGTEEGVDRRGQRPQYEALQRSSRGPWIWYTADQGRCRGACSGPPAPSRSDSDGYSASRSIWSSSYPMAQGRRVEDRRRWLRGVYCEADFGSKFYETRRAFPRLRRLLGPTL